jgi:DNA-binding CsgD family transcriptional regulator
MTGSTGGLPAQVHLQQETAALAEWHHLQQGLLAFPLTSPPPASWRNALETHLHQHTHGQGCIFWGKSPPAAPEKFDRFYKLCWKKRVYGFLGLAPGYLVSTTLPDIPQQLARLCSLCLALAEYQTLLHLQLHQLAPVVAKPSLTPREQAVLMCLVRGQSEEQTAERLGVTQATVHTHRQSLYRRLDVHNEQQAKVRAFDLGVVDWLEVPMPIKAWEPPANRVPLAREVG